MMARMKATPSGAKKRPCKPVIVSTGRNTTADDERRVNHRAADFDRRVQHDLEERARRGQGEILPQAAQDVLHVDDRVVHDHADGHGEAAERHGIHGDALPIEHDHGREQGQRNGDERNERRAQIEQEQKQHHGHQAPRR